MNDQLIYLTKETPEIWHVILDAPPVNIFGPKSILQFRAIMTEIESNERLKVVIFESAIEGFFLTHYDFVSPEEETSGIPLGATGMYPWPDLLVRLSRAPVVSIAKIRGRATGCGSELALACDMRFASLEKTIMGHFEVGAGIVPGGGPMARLPRLMGRGRAMEVLMSAGDFSGELAERYGYVNRSFPDSELDGFVDDLAKRIATFDKQTLTDTKRFVDVASLPPDYEVGSEMAVCYASIDRPATQKRIKYLLDHGLHKAGDVETRLGFYVGQINKQQ